MRTTAFLVPILLALTALAAHAHPYLAAPRVEIGDARSLPWNGATDFGVVADYDVSARLIPDTLALLGSSTPPLVRYETLRRAALYLSPRFAGPRTALPVRLQLARRLRQRVDREGVPARVLALARFDAGCFEALCAKDRTLSSGRDGYAEAKTAFADLPEATAELHYVLSRIAPPGPAGDEHHGQALDGAVEGSLLAGNLLADLQHEYADLAALREALARALRDPSPLPDFPQPPPVPGADPARRHEVVLLVPSALSVRPTEDGALAVGWVKADPLPVRLAVGHRMIVGTRIDEGVWVGDERVPAHDSETLMSGEPLDAVDATGFLRDLPGASPEAAVVLRAHVQVFETDVPPQHHWSPTGGRHRVLWERTYEVRLR